MTTFYPYRPLFHPFPSSSSSVQVYQPRRAPGNHGDFSASAPPFVPLAQQQQQSPHQQGSMYSNQQNYSPPRGNVAPYPTARSPPGTPLQPGPGQQVQYAPQHGPGSSSHSGLIDPCNLFIKNLDATVDSNDLFTNFRPYGQIVSARVMRTETGASRGFGFVSFQTPEQAAAALNGMNNAMLGGKQIVVRLHEPKQLRQEKLANRYSTGRSPHPRSASGATSPSQSVVGEGEVVQGGWTSPGAATPERVRRSSGSYYHAALSGTLNLPMRYEELSALSPVVRKEVLTGELSRRLKSMPADVVPPNEIDNIVDSLVMLGLTEVLEGIQDPEVLAQQIRTARGAEVLNEPEPQIIEAAPAPVSQVTTPAPPASAPEHPSTPISIAASLSEPPRTSSPSGSLLAASGISLTGASERDKLASSVSRFEPDAEKAQQITDLLMTLSKKERAMCNFNAEFLRKKVAEAKEVLEADEEEEAVVEIPAPAVTSKTPVIPSTPASSTAPVPAETPVEVTFSAAETTAPEVASSEVKEQSPPTPLEAPKELSVPEAADDRASVHTAVTTTTAAESVAPSHTVESLARLPAEDIVKLASSSNASTTSLPIPKADSAVVRETDAFVDGLEGMTMQQQKQAVGGRLWKVVKAFNVTKNVRSPVDGVYSAASFVTEKLRFFY
ncbi:hypothetical protein FRC03_010942 [Tulasnella sp. 419]|nr:hypothetical protein FRC03_010942 [Tulasnella sp. 419]